MAELAIVDDHQPADGTVVVADQAHDCSSSSGLVEPAAVDMV